MSLVASRSFPLLAALGLSAVTVAVVLVALPHIAAAASSAKIVEVDAHGTVHDGDLTQVIADCPSGYEATGGGYTIESINPADFIEMNAPLSPDVNDGVWGWAVTMLNQTGVDVRLDVAALCMK